MLSKILQHFRPGRPHLVYLRRVFDEIARHAGAAEAWIFHVRKHSVERVTEFVKRSPDFVVSEQSRFARRRFRDVEMIRDHRLGCEQTGLLNISVHTDAAAFWW